MKSERRRTSNLKFRDNLRKCRLFDTPNVQVPRCVFSFMQHIINFADYWKQPRAFASANSRLPRVTFLMHASSASLIRGKTTLLDICLELEEMENCEKIKKILRHITNMIYEFSIFM
uniref:Uncharacterized protein n=1 Tax=Cucumis melo TaxID=3656 RepID=A0A9I9E574_CUCME